MTCSESGPPPSSAAGSRTRASTALAAGPARGPLARISGRAWSCSEPAAGRSGRSGVGVCMAVLRPAWASVGLCRDEPVPDVADRADQCLVLGAELGAQPAHMHVNGPGAAEVVIAPHLLQQLRPGEDPARVLGQELQQLELLEGQVKDAPVQPGRVGGLIDDELAGAG